MKQPRLLLITPTFHGYGLSIGRGFESLGYDVTVHEYDRLAGVCAKVGHKMRVELPARLGMGPERGVEVGRDTAARIRSLRPDVILLIRGDDVADEVFSAMDEVGARRVLWLWDEVRRTRHTAESLDRFPQLISYSPIDTQTFLAQGRECLHVANAFDHTMIPQTARHTSGILFIGARYPRRQRLVEALVSAHVPVTTVGRSWSRHLVDRARTWEWRRPNVRALRDVPREAGYEMTAGAAAALNIHYDQDGFTMKTFEVPGVGGVQLIDRPDVAELYDPGSEVLVYESEEEMVELARRCLTDDRWGDRIREAGRRRTLAEHTFVHRAREVEKLWA